MNERMSDERLEELKAKVPNVPALTGNTFLTADEAKELFAEIQRLALVLGMWEEYFGENETDIRHARIAELEAEVAELKQEMIQDRDEAAHHGGYDLP